MEFVAADSAIMQDLRYVTASQIWTLKQFVMAKLPYQTPKNHCDSLC